MQKPCLVCHGALLEQRINHFLWNFLFEIGQTDPTGGKRTNLTALPGYSESQMARIGTPSCAGTLRSPRSLSSRHGSDDWQLESMPVFDSGDGRSMSWAPLWKREACLASAARFAAATAAFLAAALYSRRSALSDSS